MRISTSLLFQQNGSQISNQQSELYKIQQQISAKSRLLTPADDPIAAANSLQIQQGQSISKQFDVNIRNAKTDLGQGESTLGSVGDSLQSIRELIVKSRNAVLTASDKNAIATEIDNNLQDLIGLANTRDGNGRYLFSGYQDSVQPFSTTGGPYLGDDGQRTAQVGPTRYISVNASGGYLFDRVPATSGVYETAAATANTGNATISSPLNVAKPTTPTTPYQIRFTSATTFNVEDVTNPGSPVVIGAANQTYLSGMTITVDGKEVILSGSPANADVFSLKPSSSQNLFTTVQNVITALRTPLAQAGVTAQQGTTLDLSLAQIDNALSRTLEVRTSFGAKLSELDTLSGINSTVQENLDQQLEDLTGLDYPKAISDLNARKTALEAAQLSFSKISSLSLFNYIQ